MIAHEECRIIIQPLTIQKSLSLLNKLVVESYQDSHSRETNFCQHARQAEAQHKLLTLYELIHIRGAG